MRFPPRRVTCRRWITTGPALAALCVALAAAISSHAQDWPTYQHDVQHTGRSPASFDPAALQFVRKAPTGFSVPLIVGNNAISMKNQQGIGADTTRVASFNLANGSVNWEYTGKFVFPSQPTYAEGLVVFHAQDQAFSGTKLYVLDAATGALKYTVNGGGSGGVIPTVHRNPNNQKLTAYVTAGSQLQAIELGPTSGTVLWSRSGSFGGSSIPTIVGNSVVLAGPGQYYAFDQTTGAANHFQSGGISGGGGTTVAYDATGQQLYVLEYYNTIQDTLTAYTYTGNNTVVQKWQKTGVGIQDGASVAIGPDGKIYSASNSTLTERDPDTGEVLRSLPGQSFANGMTPALSDGYIWTFTQNDTRIFDLDDFQLVKILQGSRGSLNSAYDSPGAIGQGLFLLDYGNIYNSPGFDVYAIPEPAAVTLLAPAATLLLRRRRP